MKNIHLFETKNAFDKAKSGLILPRVSYITENKNVKYNPTFDANGHEFVEIAGIKWAKKNVGANSITDSGLYFQWGDTKGYTEDQIGRGENQKKFARDWSDYKWYDKATSTFTKYNSSGETLDLEDDAVHAAWKGSWRMPTVDEFLKLYKAIDKEWTDSYNKSGVAGIICKDKNTHEELLFFPACGTAINGTVEYMEFADGMYWLSSLSEYNSNMASYFSFHDTGMSYDDGEFYYGLPVRGVLAEN